MSNFDKKLEEELAKLEKEKKKKKKVSVDPIVSKDLTSGRYSYLPSASIRETVSTLSDDDDDIAPVRTVGSLSKKDEDDSKLDFFQKGAFDDGYQFGDITKTILGTASDAGLNVFKGLAGLGEGLGDLVNYGIAGIADAAGKDDWADGVRKRTQENFVDQLTKGADDYLNQYSILGRTSDSILQGVGQVGGIMATGGLGAAAGLGAAGTTALTTGLMGLSGMGSGMGEAYQNKATDLQALKHGLNSGAADALSELIFGGLGKAVNAVGFSKGLSSADDMLAKLVGSKFKNQAAKNIVEFGIKAGAEGLEEVIAGFAQAVSKHNTYMSDEDLIDILKDENLLEQFIVGAATSGLAQAPGLHIANTSKTDFITGQTQNEQAVIKKEIENRIAEAEKDGKKLTAKEKSRVEAQVEKDMEKGYISTDTIEEVLGGETYQRYKQTVDSENSLLDQQKTLQEEFDTLNKMKQGEMTGEQIDRRTDLKEELAKLKETIESTQNHSPKSLLKQQLSESVSEMVRSDRLIESYNERSRRGQAFEADLTKYDAKQRAVVQKAVESGILNNTNRTHEFVDMVAKISADKGVLFDFTNNAKLKESGFAVDGKAVNGYVTKDGITLNMDSSKAWQSTVGHEITHVLEGTDLYTELQKAVVDYAKAKNDYQGRFDSLSKLYEGIEGADINAELTADLVGDYLFTDSDFINNLSTNHRNVFQKIYDEVKYLLKVATAGSKEARELEKVKRAFDKAYKADSKTSTETDADVAQESPTQYSVSVTDPETIDFLENQEHITTYKAMVLIDGKLYPPMASKVKGEDGKYRMTNPRELGEWQQATEDTANIKFNDKGIGYYDLKKDDGGTVKAAYNPYEHSSNLVLNDQFEAAYKRDNLVTVECEIPVSELNSGYKAEHAKDSVGMMDWHSGVVAGKLKDNKRKVYLSRYLKAVRILSDAETAAKYKEIVGDTPVPFNVVSPGLLAELEKIGVNIDYEGSPQYKYLQRKAAEREAKKAKYSLSAEQQEFFKDSVVRDENGNLKVMYHGTSKGGFNVFDTYGSNYGLFGTGSYFTDSKTIGESYTKKGKGKNPQVYEAYLNIKNPMDMDAAADPAEWAKAFPDADFPESGTNEQFYRAVEEFYADQWMSKWEVAEEIQAGIESNMGYDGITHIGGGRVNANGERHQVYIAFQPEQIKNIDNTKPTDNPDIRYSLSDSNGKKLSAEQSEYFKDSKAVDENGNLKVVYHGTRNADFTVFKRNVNFFTDSKEMADSYSPNGDMYEGYVNITKPYEIDAQGEKWSKIPIDDATKNFLQEYGASVFKEGGKWRTTPADLASAIEEAVDNGDMDYDGIIIKNIDDTGSYYKGNDKHIATDYIVFNSNQFKNADNTKPTADKDIRFSLSEAVEETKDLLAVHNLTSDQVLKSLELGGLPMPSIAVVKSDGVHNEYGEISLILPKESIDPKANRANKVYGGDVWTPTYPRIEYKPSKTVEKKISDKYYGLARQIGYDAVRPLYRYVNELEDSLNRDGGEAAMLKKLYDDTDMMNLYLQDSGKGKIDPIEKETVTKISEAEAEMNQFFIDSLGEDLISSVWVPKDVHPAAHRKAFMEQNKSSIEETYKRYCMEEFGFTEEEAENVLVNTSQRDLLRFVRNAAQYIRNKGVTVRTEIDSQATTNAIREAAADGYKEWVDSLFKGVEEKTGIRNNQEYFTRSGNRRSWDALHWENTLENVIKAMKGEEETGAGSFSPYNTFASIAHKRYGSIAEIKADSDRLGKVSAEEYEALEDSLSNRLAAIATSIKDPAARNEFIAADEAAGLIVDAVRTQKTKAGMLNYLQKYNKRVTGQTVEDIVSLVNDISNMPTGYFEAKPQRAVGFDEVGVFVIPYDADVKLKQELLNRGYAIAEYDPKVEGDRQRVVNQFEEYKFSLSNIGEQPKQYGNYSTPARDLRLEIAPVAENATSEVRNVTSEATTEETTEVVSEDDLFPDEPTPQMELDSLNQEKETLEGRMMDMANSGDLSEFESVNTRYTEVQARIEELENEISESEDGRMDSIGDEDVPPEMDAPYYGEPSEPEAVPDPFADRDMNEVGNRKVKAYQYENPEVKPFFTEAAYGMLDDLRSGTKGEKIYNDQLHYDSGGEHGWMGTKRHTTDDIADLLDNWHYTYAEIEKGLNAIIEDDGKENNAVSKRIEFMLHDRLVNGYTGVWGDSIPANQDYINLLEEKQINEYSKEAFDSFMATADQYAPAADDIAPVAAPVAQTAAEVAPVKEEYVAVTPQRKRKKEPKMVRADKPFDQKTANVLVNEPKVEKKKNGLWSIVKENILDNGMVFEDLALKTKNRDLQAKWNFIRYAQSMAQRMVGNGAENVKSLNAIREEVEKSGKTQEFFEYLYHWLNVDRMTLENRYEDTPNKAVFGDSVTADMSRVAAVELAKANPDFRRWAQDVYRYNRHLRTMMVNNGVISQETADLWQEMYPHYVPIRRVGDTGLNINVPLDTGRTGVNAPIKKATGGNSDILPLFDTMAQRTLQTYKAIAKNSFGVELKNTLGTTITKEQTDIDGVIDSVDNHEELLQKGKKGKKPTFTVFENGEKVTFEITDEMYNAMKPASDLMSYTNPVANTFSNLHRGLLTEYNPVFMATNAIKDTQDILINSQHPVRTYANLPRATWQIAKNGKWFKEYMDNGGEDNTYFDGENNSFDTEEKGMRKLLGIPPLSWISKANNFIERTPRLAEYIASREAGRSIEVSMLDAARVTTNFAAGGKLTKFANRNGATFLNASVQGVVQQARNFREAKANGLKGWAQLAGKFALAGLPALLLNNLMWDDDDEYEELSDYVKQNYYIVGKYGDGKFVRIPKGRTLAIIQNAFEQVSNAVTGNDEADLKSFLELVVSNLAPNNPVEDNILAPIIQVANNETWYGEDLVPTRLQDLPAAEQFDESTDAISKWLGEKLNFSPYKINYLLDQYSGGIGDTFLPMLTPEAESGDNTFLGNVLAPAKSKFTTDSVMNNQNVSDFYDTVDELTTNAKSSKATDEDKLKSKYMNSVSSELSELYARQRRIQNSGFSAEQKYRMTRDIQQDIVDLMKEGLGNYQNVSYEDDYRAGGEYARVGNRLYKLNDDGEWSKLSDDQVTKYEVTKAAGDKPYATDGTNHYRWYEKDNDWRKVTDDQLEKQNEVTSGLGITPEDYWSKKEEYDYAYENPESYAVAKAVGGYDAYKQYSSELYDIKADKDEYGKSISGSRKEKVLDYIDGLDADYYTKLILYKSEYNSYDDENYEIIEYLNSRDDISFEEEIAILRKLGFDVTAEGDISW